MDEKRACNGIKRMIIFLLAVALFFNGWVNYDFRVEAAEGNLNVNLASANAEYSGNEFEPENLIESVTRKEDPSEQVSDYTVTVTKDGTETAILDAGTYQITVTENMAESESVDSPNSGSAEFTVSQLDLSGKKLLINNAESGYENDFVYNGKEIVPEVKLEGISEALYTVAVTGAVNAGEEVKIVITAPENNSNVTGEISKSIPVSAKSIVDATVTLEKSEEVLIEDAEYLPSVTQITFADGTILSNTEMESNGFQVTVKDAENNPVTSIKDPGEYQVEVKAGGNYEGKATGKYTLGYAPETEGMVLLDGKTLSENVYDEKVTLKSGAGYEICKDQTTEYTESNPEGVKVLVKNKQTNEISNYQTPGFAIDKTSPELTLGVPEGQDNKNWTTSKTINVTADDDNLYGVYYTENDVITDDLISEIPEGLTKFEGNSLEIKEIIKNERTYYFYAIDKAGHVTKAEMPVDKIDTEAPKIEGINTEKPYWKSSADRVVDFTLTDLSGVASDSIKVEMQGDDGSFSRLDIDLTYSDEQQTLVSAGKITVKYPGIYKVTALDQAGNTAEATFEVKQDTSAPDLGEISEDAVKGSNKYYDKDIYWFDNPENITVDLSVTKEEAPEGEEVSPNKIVYSTDQNFNKATEIVSSETDKSYTFQIEIGKLPENGEVTYYFKAVDEAGNESNNVQEIKFAYDGEVAKNLEIKLPQKNEETGWINDKETEKIEINLKFTEAKSGIDPGTIEYDLGEGYIEATGVTFNSEDGSYSFSTKEDVPEGVIGSWKIRVSDNVKNIKEYEFTESIQIDRTAPESEAYIKFFTDMEENKGVSEVVGTEENVWKQIGGWFSDQWKRLWGKRKVTFEVYVKDKLSGFSENASEAIKMSYQADDNEETIPVSNLEFVNGVSALVNGDTDNTVSIYRGSITISEASSSAISNFRIDMLTDRVGNSLTETIIPGNAENQDIIYLDDVAPKLTDVSIKNESVYEKDRYFYNESTIVKLSIEERFFDEGGITPEVTVLRRCTGGNTDDQSAEVALKNFEDVTTEIEISDWSKGENPHSATVTLPKEDGKEYEYQIQVSYTDASDNKLEGINVENGVFTSKIFVVDGIAPTLKYRVNPAGNCTVDGAAVYKNAENDDLEVTITIDDNETYYETAKSNLTAKVYRKGEKEAVKVKELKISEDSAKKVDALTPEQENGRIHEYSFGFDGESPDSENEYYVTVFYVDAAGNQLIKDPAEDSVEPGCEVTSGTYTSKSYIIDHVAPAFDASYNDAVSIVNGDGEDEPTGTKQPKADYTAYYSAETNGIKATYTIVEKYTNTESEVSNAPENHNPNEELIKITKYGVPVDTADTNSYVTWEKVGTKYKATVTIPAEKDHSTDGDYQITIQNSDCAGNLMVQEDSENDSVTNLLKEGTYTSPVLVLDTTVPKVEAYYQDGNHKKVPECTKNGRDYFNRNTEDLKLLLKITDGAEKTNETEQIKGNIRLQGLSEVLKNMKAFDVNGTDLKESTNAWKYIDGEVNPTTMSREWITVMIPLTSEANYDIPIGFTDLSGNKAIVTEPDEDKTEHKDGYTEYVTFDKTEPDKEVYIQFESDTLGKNDIEEVGEKTNKGWLSKIWQMAQKVWSKIWGRNEIQFSVYVKDEISGIDSLTMDYDGNELEDLKRNKDFVDITIKEDGKDVVKEGYVRYQGSIKNTENTAEAIKKLQIASLNDAAGNAVEKIILNNDGSEEIIYLDNVAPKLEVSFENAETVDEGKHFYNKSTDIKLSIEERFFDEGGITPEVTVLRRCTGGNTDDQSAEVALKNFEAVTTEIVISDWSKEENSHSATVTLPKEDGKEYEYKLEVSYTDASGNKLVGTGVTDDGVFTSEIFVVDGIVPTLQYRVNDPTKCKVNDVAVYENIVKNVDNAEENDLEVDITIDDNEEYYNNKNSKSKLVVNIYRKNEQNPVKKFELDKVNPVSKNGRIHEYSLGFDGDPLDSENEYYVTVSYADAAGNQLIKDPAKDSVEPGCEVTDGTYKSKSYIIDHVAPAFNASYNDAVSIVNGDGEDETTGTKKPKKGYMAYYSAETNGIKATYTIVEKYTNTESEVSNAPENHNPNEELIKITKNGVPVDTADTNSYVTWEKSLEKDGKTKYKATVTIPAEEDHSTDGDYQIIIQNSDCAGNRMVQEDSDNASVSGLLKNGTYTSPVLVLDTTVPKVKAYYQDGDSQKIPECTKNGRDYFNHNTEELKLVLEITDGAEKTNETEQIKGNIRLQELSEVLKNMKALDVKDKDLTKDTNAWKYIYDEVELKKATMSRESITVTIPLTSEANYNIPIGFTDLAGNKAIVTEPDGTEHKPTEEMSAYTEYVTFDKTTSEITVKTIDGRTWKNKVLEVGEDTEVELAQDSDIRYEVINDGKFAQIINKLTFGYFAKKQIRVTITAHDPISGVENIYYRYETKDSQDGETIDYRMLENAKTDHSDKSRMTGSVDLPISFKGVITAYAVDVAENSAKDELSGGVGLVAEDAQMHEERSDNSVKVISDYSKTPDYYNGDVKIRFSSKDDYSGIRFIEYLAGNDKIASDHFEHSGKPIITERWIKDYTIRSESNNENNIRLALSFVDNAGHARKVPESELPKINIDTTEPKISVEYDNNDFLNEKYYKEERTATVTVEERNFDPNDVTFDLTGPTVLISDWRHIGNGGCHGGSDPSNTGHTDECKWVCEVHFREDGDYTFGFSCTDLAGNKGAYNLVDEFVIDKTMPEIEVEYNNHDVQNEFYYNAPRRATITIHEHNFDAGDVEITMTAKDDGVARAVPGVSGWSNEGDFHRATIDFDYDAEFTFDVAYEDLAGNKAEDYTEDHFVVDLTAPELEIFDIVNMSANNGEVRPGIRYHDTNYDPEGTRINMIGYQNGIQEMNGTRDLEANGLELKLDDFPYVPESDDMYTMEAVVYDLAGNSSEDSVMFSVNRFGSVYTFDEATEKLVGKDGKYYTNKEQDLVVYETNVDTLEFKEITCNLNGKLQTLKENEDYFVEVSGSDVTWKQYTYKLLKENFAEEGTYVITIYSEDRATNVSDNNTKEKKIEFVVDKTNPSILISGVEDGKQYLESSRTVTLDVQDNIRIHEVKVTLDEKETVYDAAQLEKTDGKITLSAKSANHWQKLQAEIIDAAGNVTETEEIRFVITANIFVQFFMNKPLFYGTLAIALAVGSGCWWFIAGKKRKKEDEEA